jgi:hypothetical protein
MDRVITKTELEGATNMIISAMRSLEDILCDVEKEAKADYDNILKISDRLTMRAIRLWHKYSIRVEEEKEKEKENTTPDQL